MQSGNQIPKYFQAKDVPISEIVGCMSGNSGLTEQYLYSLIQTDSEKKYRILTASTDNEQSQYTHRCPHPKDSSRLIAVIEGRPVIHVVRIGKAGFVTYFEEGDYTITENAYLLYLKDNLKYEVSLKWLMYALSPQFSEYSNLAEYGTWNMTGFLENVKIDIPLFERQVQIVRVYEKLEELKRKIVVICQMINAAKNKQLGYQFISFQGKDVPISEILSCLSGNSGLTEEYLYSQIQTDSERKYRILTGSTAYSISEYIHRCEHPKNATKLISVIEDKPIIHVVRKGKAGSTAYFEKGNYTINDDAYLLFLKEAPQKTILGFQNSHQVNLKWLMYDLKSRFYDYSSSSDNGTWNKTRFFDEVKVDIPSYAEQNQIVAMYDKLEKLEKTVTDFSSRIEDLLKKQVAQD